MSTAKSPSAPVRNLLDTDRIKLCVRVLQHMNAFLKFCFPNGSLSPYGEYWVTKAMVLSPGVFWQLPYQIWTRLTEDIS